MKKIHIFWLILILSFILFLIFIFVPKNYTKKYEVNKVKINESYNKIYQGYYFTFKYNNIEFDYLIESKYKEYRTFIKKVKIVKDEEGNFCLVPNAEKLEFIPLCYDNKEIIHYNLVNDELKKKLASELFKKEQKLESYKDIEIYNKDYTYLLWNYDGFYYLDNAVNKKIDIFDKEFYNINLIGYTKDYLVIADYDSNYTFNNLYTIDYKKGNLKKHELDRSIYFDSYYIGYEKNKLYIVDNKESLMYEFNAKNGDLDKIKSKILKNGEWKKANIKTLINKKQEFEYTSNYNYEYKDNNIYLSYQDKDIKTLITKDVTYIVRIKDRDIYYLKDDTLYHFNTNVGEEKLLNYFEWNFNYERMIYIN